MSEEIVESTVAVEESEPIYYSPKSLNLVTAIARVFSWVVLVGFVLLVVGNYINLQELTQGAALTEIIKQGAARTWIYTNLAMPLLTGLAMFITLQGISVGLDVLLEIDFNARESAK